MTKPDPNAGRYISDLPVVIALPVGPLGGLIGSLMGMAAIAGLAVGYLMGKLG